MDTDIALLNHVPIAVFYIGFSAFFIGVLYMGRARSAKKQLASGEAETPNTFVQNTIFALIAFFLAFTFSMAGTLYDKRRALLIDHAVAISTAYAETDFLGPREADNSRSLYLEYVNELVALERRVVSTGQSLRDAEGLLDQLWSINSAYVTANPSPITVRYSNSLVAVGDLHKERVDRALWMTVPDVLILQFVLLTAFALYNLGRSGTLANTRQRIAIPIVYAVVFSLIVDLNRPFGGLFGVNQEPILDVLAVIHADLGTPPDG